MSDAIELGMLFDLYGSLLTGRQYNILDLHINYDLSLTEISEQLSISRQGVYDNINRARKQLMEYEKKLNLLYRLRKDRELGSEALKALDEGDLEKVKEFINEILEG